ncbi:MAG: hypothetical protein ACR2OH_03140 [Microthrixaceae bacterium]
MTDNSSGPNRTTGSDAPEASASIVRYRCTACGNLTRFDVTATRRTRAFHHYDVSGELSVEDTEVLSEVIEEVSCRWCGNASAVVIAEAAPTAGADSDTVPPDTAPPETGR